MHLIRGRWDLEKANSIRFVRRSKACWQMAHPKVCCPPLPHDRGQSSQLAQEAWTEAVHALPRRVVSMSLFVPLLEFNRGGPDGSGGSPDVELYLAHVQTAVQREVRSRREGSFIAGEPGDDRGDLAGFSETAHRNALDDRIEDLGAHRANHVGPDVPGRDGIHRDAPSSPPPGPATS